MSKYLPMVAVAAGVLLLNEVAKANGFDPIGKVASFLRVPQ